MRRNGPLDCWAVGISGSLHIYWWLYYYYFYLYAQITKCLNIWPGDIDPFLLAPIKTIVCRNKFIFSWSIHFLILFMNWSVRIDPIMVFKTDPEPVIYDTDSDRPRFRTPAEPFCGSILTFIKCVFVVSGIFAAHLPSWSWVHVSMAVRHSTKTQRHHTLEDEEEVDRYNDSEDQKDVVGLSFHAWNSMNTKCLNKKDIQPRRYNNTCKYVRFWGSFTNLCWICKVQ